MRFHPTVEQPLPKNTSNTSSRRATLESHFQQTTEKRNGLRSIESRWSLGRLLSFTAALVWLWYFWNSATGWAFAGFVAFIFLFTYTVSRHRTTRNLRELADRNLLVTEESLKRCDGRVALIRSRNRPTDANAIIEEFDTAKQNRPCWSLTEQERDDLDFYSAPVGLFGLLNRCSTIHGERRLRDVIEHPCLTVETIQTRQQAVKHLRDSPAERLQIMAGLATQRDRDEYLDHLTQTLAKVKPLPNESRLTLLRIWSLFTALVIGVCFFLGAMGFTIFWYVIILLSLINGMMYGSIRKMLQKHLAPWRTVRIVANGVLHATKIAVDNLPQTGTLGELRNRLAATSQKHTLPQFCSRVGWSESGGFMQELFNIFFFFDLHVLWSIVYCVHPRRSELLSGLGALAELEMLASLACFAYESGEANDVCMPTFVDEPVLEMSSAKHPLMSAEHAVGNDITLNAELRLWIITGSNMAGKSTLLRVCGVNCLLAQIGTVAIARAMRLTPLRLISDLQVRDNLAEDESYFLAEVRHLRRLVHTPSTEKFKDVQPKHGLVLGLMDEPFRGTNSLEQIAAALAVTEHLLTTEHFFLIATHEQQLTNLADRYPQARNYHFRENLGEDGMVYDYLLREGPATTRNAIRVLEREGYPETLINRANEWASVLDTSERPAQ